MMTQGNSETAEDLVCHMRVDMGNPAGGTHEHEGTTYYFCSAGCQRSFSQDPSKYIRAEGSTHEHGGH